MFDLPKGAVPVERISVKADPSIPCAALHLGRYCWAASRIVPRSNVLDIACGTGYGSALLASIPANVIGVDCSQDAVGEADRLHTVPEGGGCVDFVCSDAMQFLEGWSPRSIDHVVSFETLEHVDNMGEFLARLLCVFRISLLFSVPHNEPFGSWPYHKTFEITKEKIQSLVPASLHVEFFGQEKQPFCTIKPYWNECSDLLVFVSR